MSMAAILLAMTPLASAHASPIAAATDRPARGAIAVSASASARILKPAIVTFEASGNKGNKNSSGAVQPQRRVERSDDKRRAAVWIEFS